MIRSIDDILKELQFSDQGFLPGFNEWTSGKGKPKKPFDESKHERETYYSKAGKFAKKKRPTVPMPATLTPLERMAAKSRGQQPPQQAKPPQRTAPPKPATITKHQTTKEAFGDRKPKEGDRKRGAQGDLELRRGRWHRAYEKLEKLASAHERDSDKHTGGTGLPVGGVDIDGRIKADAIRQVMRLHQQGVPMDQAVAKTKADARRWFARHNQRRPHDVNWKRWDGGADSHIEHAAKMLGHGSKAGQSPSGSPGFQALANRAKSVLGVDLKTVKPSLPEHHDVISLGKRLGVEVVLLEGSQAGIARGMTLGKTVALTTGQSGDAFWGLAGHELAHATEIDKLRGVFGDVSQFTKRYEQKNPKWAATLTEEQKYREGVAEMARDFFSDKRFRAKLTEEKQGVADFIHSKVSGMLKGFNFSDSKLDRMAQEFQKRMAKPASDQVTLPGGDKVDRRDSFNQMVDVARGWNHAAMKHGTSLADDPRARRQFERTTAKSDLDKWLQDQFGFDATDARAISNKAGELGPKAHGEELPGLHWKAKPEPAKLQVDTSSMSDADAVRHHLKNDDPDAAFERVSKMRKADIENLSRNIAGIGFHNDTKKQMLEKMKEWLPKLTAGARKTHEASSMVKAALHEFNTAKGHYDNHSEKRAGIPVVGVTPDEHDALDPFVADPHGDEGYPVVNQVHGNVVERKRESLRKVWEAHGKASGMERPKELDGPKDGDRNAAGLVFRNHRWHREEQEKPVPESQPGMFEGVETKKRRGVVQDQYSSKTGTQKSMFSGLDADPGQGDLFDADYKSNDDAPKPAKIEKPKTKREMRESDKSYSDPHSIKRERNTGASLTDHDSALFELQDAHDALERAKEQKNESLRFLEKHDRRYDVMERRGDDEIRSAERRKVRKFNAWKKHADRLEQQNRENEELLKKASAPKPAKIDRDAEAFKKSAPGLKKRLENEERAHLEGLDRAEESRKWNENYLKIAADSPDKLRAQDVYRLLEGLPDDRAGNFENWLIKQRPDLAATINETSQELLEEKAAGKSSGDDGPKEGDRNDDGLVFRNHRWHREDEPEHDTSEDAEAIRKLRGLDGDKINNYQPQVRKLGRDWYAVDINGKEFPSGHKTKRKAMEQAERHGELSRNVWNNPTAYGNRTRETASWTLERAEQYQKKGMSEHNAMAKAKDDLHEFLGTEPSEQDKLVRNRQFAAGIVDRNLVRDYGPDKQTELEKKQREEAKARIAERKKQGAGGPPEPAKLESGGFDAEKHGGHKNFAKLAREISEGNLSIDEVKAAHKIYHDGRDEYISDIKKRLNANQLKVLAHRLGSWDANSSNKSENAKYVYEGFMRMAFDIGPSGAVESYGMKELQNPFAKMDRLATNLGKWTQDDLDKHVAEVKKNTENRKAEDAAHDKALKNPETLEDYRKAVRAKVELSPAQKRKRDELEAADSRGKRDAKADEAKTVKALGEGAKGVGEFKLSTNYHSKRGHDIFTASPQNRVEREDYNELNRKAKQLGGWYYKAYKGTPGGFHFPDEESRDKFLGLMKGDADASGQVDAQREKQMATRHGRLRDLASRMRESGQQSLAADRKDNTARRARMAASAEARANEQIAMAATIENIADAVEDGKVKYLDGISHGTHVETLDGILRSARSSYAYDVGEDYHDKENKRFEPFGEQHVERVEFPHPTIHKDHVLEATRLLKGKRGVSYERRMLEDMANRMGDRDWQVRMDTETKRDAFDAITKKLRQYPSMKHLREKFSEGGTRYSRLKAANIHNEFELREALREYVPLRSKQAKADPVKEAERSLRGKKLPGFFPTPPKVVDMMLDRAGIQDGHSVLEPSAGKGDILDAIKDQHPGAKRSAIEMNSTLHGVLDAKGHDYAGGDFLDHDKSYDRIVMNPPFEKYQDVDHVQHAFERLNSGGRLVSVMGASAFNNSHTKAAEFRKWLDKVGADYEKLPDGSFAGDDSFNQTGVSTYLVTIDKPQSRQARQFSEPAPAQLLPETVLYLELV